MSGLILPLSRATDVRDAGAKASNLARLIQLGHPVPEGFAITDAAFQAFLDAHDLHSVVSRLTRDLDVRRPDEIIAAADAISRAVLSCGLPPDFAADLDLSLAPLLSDRLIVRSSALGEDSGDASFAGQLDSIADGNGAAAVRSAILRVWASRWTARALTYELARGHSLAGMGIVVQRQIASAVSGVLFTISPQDETEMVLEYCGGSSEALVGGSENPGRVLIRRSDLRWRQTATPDARGDGDDPLLDSQQLQSLARSALEIEAAFGRPQDIEWTVDREGRLWFVQTRPITVYAGRDTVRTEHWSNANVNENFPQPISPLLYSIARTGYYHYFRNLGRAFGFSAARLAAMEEPLRHIIGVHGARMYYNLTSIHGILRSAPFGEHLAAWFNQFVGSEDTNAPAFVDAGLASDRRAATRRSSRSSLGRAIGQAWELAIIAVCTAWQYSSVTRRVERFERTVSEYAARTRPDQLSGRNRRELLEDLRGFIDIRNHRWLDASLADAASMVCYGALKRTLSAEFPAADQAALHNSLLKALPNLPSSQPALKLWDLSRMVRGDGRLLRLFAEGSTADAVQAIRRDPELEPFNQALEAFLDDWGFRCSGELMLTVPSFQEDTAPLIAILKAYAGLDAPSPADHLAAQREERLRETDRIASVLRQRRLLPYLPGFHRWHVVSVLLRWTQHAIILRERARLKQALLYSRLRRVSLALGERLTGDRRLERPEDIFFLSAGEIDDLVSGYAMFPHHVRDLVAVRRHAHAQLGAAAPPDSVRLARGEYLPEPAGPGAAGPGELRTRGDSTNALTGLGVCGGTTTARAAVLRDVTETHLLQPGDVLITRQTDPGWGAVFPLISGLVMERGGMLSHGAIIAREFGIPSVVGIGDATRLIPHGRDVHVDGDRGVVQIEGAA